MRRARQEYEAALVEFSNIPSGQVADEGYRLELLRIEMKKSTDLPGNAASEPPHSTPQVIVIQIFLGYENGEKRVLGGR